MERDSDHAAENRRIAVSLTYDGALPEHLDVAGPTLAEMDLKGTFFLSPTRTLENVRGWQALAEAGHEMGNGSLLGVSNEGRLENWTLRMVEQDLHMTQGFFGSILPEGEPVSFAYPGADPDSSQGSYRHIVDEAFEFARSETPGDNRPGAPPTYLKMRDLSAITRDELLILRMQLMAELDEPPATPIWHVLRFGKMFEGDSNHALMVHELCLTFLATQKESLWIAPLRIVAESFLSPLRVSITS